jgi:TolB protein
MKRKTCLLLTSLAALSVATLIFAQDINIFITKNAGKPSLAVVDFRGSGSQPYMAAFNSTLFSDLQGSGLFDMRAKSLYPLDNPQRPEDLRPTDNNQGLALADWAGAPVNASHLVFGYSAASNGVLALYGNVYDTRQANPQAAQLLVQRYAGTLDEPGAVRVAHQFAADIIQKFGGAGSLLGSRIYFTSNRSGAEEIWAMDWDGTNQTQLTSLKSISIMPAISPDGTRLAFTTYAKGQPGIMIIDTQSKRAVGFYNQQASMNATPTFTPDGKQLFYSSTASGGSAQIYAASVSGQDFRRISHRDAIEVEPKINPKNPSMMLLVSGPGHQQIYQMNTDGAGVDRVTNGEGEASNPAWHPDGQHLAFSWTSGIAKGDFNVFVMDIGSRQYVQLTHNEGRNENPNWGPDGRHLVFASNRTGKSQLYTMLADGSQVKQLTMQGTNRFPVWGIK